MVKLSDRSFADSCLALVETGNWYSEGAEDDAPMEHPVRNVRNDSPTMEHLVLSMAVYMNLYFVIDWKG